MPKPTISRRIRLARVVIPIGPIEKTKKEAAKASSNPCAALPTDEGPLIRSTVFMRRDIRLATVDARGFLRDPQVR